MGELMKTEKILEGNLHNLFMVVMSLCDSLEELSRKYKLIPLT